MGLAKMSLQCQRQESMSCFMTWGPKLFLPCKHNGYIIENRTMGQVLQRSLVVESRKFSAWESIVKEEACKVMFSGFYSLDSKGAHE